MNTENNFKVSSFFNTEDEMEMYIQGMYDLSSNLNGTVTRYVLDVANHIRDQYHKSLTK